MSTNDKPDPDAIDAAAASITAAMTYIRNAARLVGWAVAKEAVDVAILAERRSDLLATATLEASTDGAVVVAKQGPPVEWGTKHLQLGETFNPPTQCGVELLLYLDGQSGYCTRPAGHTGMHTGTVAPDQAVTVT